MAKRGRKSTTALATETLGSFAEDLGKLLGTAQAKASSWLDQRKQIAEQLTQIRDTASQYLQQLTGAGEAAFQRARKGRPPGSGKKTGRRGRPPGSGKRKGGMSAEGRARIAAAQRARWAKIREQQGSTKKPMKARRAVGSG